jgi:hypothetical protein
VSSRPYTARTTRQEDITPIQKKKSENLGATIAVMPVRPNSEPTAKIRATTPAASGNFDSTQQKKYFTMAFMCVIPLRVRGQPTLIR